MTCHSGAPPVSETQEDHDALLDRAAGMLAGVAIGDALGMPSEFLTPDFIQAGYGGINPLAAAPLTPLFERWRDRPEA